MVSARDSPRRPTPRRPRHACRPRPRRKHLSQAASRAHTHANAHTLGRRMRSCSSGAGIVAHARCCCAGVVYAQHDRVCDDSLVQRRLSCYHPRPLRDARRQAGVSIRVLPLPVSPASLTREGFRQRARGARKGRKADEGQRGCAALAQLVHSNGQEPQQGVRAERLGPPANQPPAI